MTTFVTRDQTYLPPRATVRAVVLDTMGTTIPLDGVVKTALVEALDEAGTDLADREQPERESFLNAVATCPTEPMLALCIPDSDRARWASWVFEAALVAALDRGEAEPLPGAEDALRRLRAAGVRTCLATALSPVASDALVDALGWRRLVDAIVPAESALRRRPSPDEILAAALRLDVNAVDELAVVGDTVGDLVAGTRAGASVVAGIIGGASDADELASAPHTHLLLSVAGLPEVVLG